MTYKPYPDNQPKSKLVVGERVLADIRRRVRELENHFRPSLADRRELSKLKGFLRFQSTGSGHD